MAIMSLALSVFDRYSLRLSADQAFKGSLVMVRLFGWLDARKKCCTASAHHRDEIYACELSNAVQPGASRWLSHRRLDRASVDGLST
jgi:hypothetical protein